MGKCTYCGDPADTVDHVVPKSYSENPSFARKYTVPCCRTCNNKLGHVFHHTVGSRARYLHGAFSKAWKKTLNTPDWADEELAELGYALRLSVVDGLKAKADCVTKLAHLDFIAITSPSIQEVWVAHDENEGKL